MDFRQPKSPVYSLGFEPLQVEEDDDEEEYEDFEELDMLTLSSSSSHYRNDSLQVKEPSNGCSEMDEDDDDVQGGSSEDEEEESSGTSEGENETSEDSTVGSQAPKDASFSQCSSSSIISKDPLSCEDTPEDGSTIILTHGKGSSSNASPTPVHNFGLQKMPSYEFKFCKDASKSNAQFIFTRFHKTFLKHFAGKRSVFCY